MKKLFLIIIFIFPLIINCAEAQNTPKADVFLLTCGPGIETYSIYGHSALRIVIPEMQTDNVYNWGVFDFSTPNFAWKFAKGRLEYMLDDITYKGFLQGYFYEERYVHSQKINLNAEETDNLISLINENLKPENRKYRYDFFYDDCSTRIRDLLEKAVGDNLLYPPEKEFFMPTFRQMVSKYQSAYPWLQLGIDLIMGSPGEARATFRDRMFLPLDMQTGLSELVIKRGTNMIPLLRNSEVVLDFPYPSLKSKFLISPSFIFTIVMIIVIILTMKVKNRMIQNLTDIIIFSLFSILAILMIFFNFFTDHPQMKWNLNILWANPFVIACLIKIFAKGPAILLFRIVFYVSIFFLLIQFLLPQHFNLAILPLLIILIVRTAIRSGFEWDPLSIYK